ncbi:MAG: phosphoesterase RecJ domain-containing protein, partial [Oscillospiraceae bacterium]|nr:phosphoesterase RecJ domain-containing protein [Oscillospiraceae bacterium]
TDCGITLRELQPGKIKISLRTGPRVDACAACAILGGGGHRAAAGATAEGTMEEVKARVLSAVAEVTSRG